MFKTFHVPVLSYWLACDLLKLYPGDISLIFPKAEILMLIAIYNHLSVLIHTACSLYHFGDDVMSSDVTQKSLENKFVFFVCGLNSFDFEMDFFLEFCYFWAFVKVGFQFLIISKLIFFKFMIIKKKSRYFGFWYLLVSSFEALVHSRINVQYYLCWCKT